MFVLLIKRREKETALAQTAYRKQLHVVRFINFHNYPRDIKGSRVRVRRPRSAVQVTKVYNILIFVVSLNI